MEGIDDYTVHFHYDSGVEVIVPLSAECRVAALVEADRIADSKISRVPVGWSYWIVPEYRGCDEGCNH